MAFHNGLEYHIIDEWLYNDNDPFTSCTNLVNFGPLGDQFELLIRDLKIGIFHQISESIAPIFIKF